MSNSTLYLLGCLGAIVCCLGLILDAIAWLSHGFVGLAIVFLFLALAALGFGMWQLSRAQSSVSP